LTIERRGSPRGVLRFDRSRAIEAGEIHFRIYKPHEGEGSCADNGLMVTLTAANPDQVKTADAAALENGARSAAPSAERNLQTAAKQDT